MYSSGGYAVASSGRGPSIVMALLLLGACGTQPAESTSQSPTATASAAESTTPTPLPTLTATTAEASEAPPGAITIEMLFGPKFDPKEATAKAGTVVFFLHNPDPGGGESHNFNIGPELHKPLAMSPILRLGQAVVFTVEGLEPGTYTYWCTFNGHEAFGMVGTLTVTP